MKKKPWKQDPFAEREEKKYENPIPSREFIMALLEKEGAPLNKTHIAERLEIAEDSDGMEALRRRLIAMVRDGQIIQNRKGAFGLISKMDLVVGRVQAHKDGFGFLIEPAKDGSTRPKSGKKGDDIFLSPREMSQVFDGDRVAVRAQSRASGERREGVIVEILERAVSRVVGRLVVENDLARVIPEQKRVHQEIIIPHGSYPENAVNQYVSVEITQFPTIRTQAQGRVLEVLGGANDPGIEIEIALEAFNIPKVWSKEVEDEADKYTKTISKKVLQHRQDLRELPFVTIDGEDAKDFDDAVYVASQGSGWKLWVAIADVSHFVKKGSAIDAEARERGTSVYLPGRVVPMLPEVLSNGLCSLMPNVDRLALVCEMWVTQAGKVSKVRFHEAVIRSHQRLTYNKVAQYINRKFDVSSSESSELVLENLKALYELYHVFRQQREIRGGIDFRSKELRIVFNPEKKIERIERVERNEAHQVIEEMMLAANVSVARAVKKLKLSGLFRNHEGPKSEKAVNLQKSLAAFGVLLPTPLTPLGLQSVLNKCRDKKESDIIELILLRSMGQAHYEAESTGHFGLSYKDYTHFTSPIRRYPDLINHRVIRYGLRHGLLATDQPVEKISAKDWLEAEVPLNAMAEQCSMTERRAEDASRDVEAMLKCQYMLDKVGNVYQGRITSVTAFGLFIELNDLMVEGLLHVSYLPPDYYHFDAERYILSGETNDYKFRIGDMVSVLVARVDPPNRQIDFDWGGKDGGLGPKKGNSKNAKGSDKKKDHAKLPEKKNLGPKKARSRKRK
ncbi:MAG: ribonuclease R [Pseudomonadota bacterium]